MKVKIEQLFKDFFSEKEPSQYQQIFSGKEPTKRKMRKKINTLEIENKMLKESTKDELYKIFMAKLGEPLEIEKLRNENKNLRKKIKTLKEIIKEEGK